MDAVATPIDAGLGTMVHALMAEGMEAVIADLHIRFPLPVALDQKATVVAEPRSRCGPIHAMAARLIQSGQVRATTRARFFETSTA